MIIKLDCEKCHENIAVNLYLSGPEIKVHEEPTKLIRTYTARARGRALCPRCGVTIDKIFSTRVYDSDILDLALRKEIKVDGLV